MQENAEVTLEANPTDAEQFKFKEFRKFGINRISIGIQSFLDEDLTFLGRKHSAMDNRNAISLAKTIFPLVSMDLIYGRHNQQTVQSWENELKVFTVSKDHG